MIHDLKCHESIFQDILNRTKPWEYRLNDRNFLLGDQLKLNEVKNKKINGVNNLIHTGREVFVEVVYILKGGQFGIPTNFVIMTIEVLG